MLMPEGTPARPLLLQANCLQPPENSALATALGLLWPQADWEPAAPLSIALDGTAAGTDQSHPGMPECLQDALLCTLLRRGSGSLNQNFAIMVSLASR